MTHSGKPSLQPHGVVCIRAAIVHDRRPLTRRGPTLADGCPYNSAVVIQSLIVRPSDIGGCAYAAREPNCNSKSMHIAFVARSDKLSGSGLPELERLPGPPALDSRAPQLKLV